MKIKILNIKNRKKYTIAIKKFIEEKLQLRILIPNKIEQEAILEVMY